MRANLTMKAMALALLALAAVAPLAKPALADPVGGAGGDYTCLFGGQSVDYQEMLYGGEMTLISVEGAGTSELDLFVYDQFGNLIASDTSFGDSCEAWVAPGYTQYVTIRVVNYGGSVNCFTIVAI